MGHLRDLQAWRRKARPALEDDLVLEPDRGCARVARRWVMSTLGAAGLGGAGNQVVELLTAELVADAIVRRPTQVHVHTRYDGVTARVEVRDDSCVPPPAQAPRSWSIVEAMAAAWGCLDAPGQTGRTVWFEVLVDG
ncbi:MAG: ATP-binding protein [Actinobacteria bacterium]|nr:ATP-binding protein [Actinomycetota bacterium]MBU4337555.1 ATP-binding protein [Actinomycetota bacterium]MCG2802570.1 ATP-binding protein [Cellulomonas sp.]